jgi:hypothetical protein
MSRQFMQEKSGSKIVWMPFSSQSWAIYLIQKRHDIEEMTANVSISIGFPSNLH